MSKDKEQTIDDILKDMVEKAVATVRSEYEKTISELEKRSRSLADEADSRLRAILAQMQPYECYNCHKVLVSGKDAIYGSFDGKKFCSHKCIDEAKDETR